MSRRSEIVEVSTLCRCHMPLYPGPGFGVKNSWVTFALESLNMQSHRHGVTHTPGQDEPVPDGVGVG